DRVAIHSNTGALTANPHILIGANIVDDHYYKGLIDDVRIYNRALSDGEVAHLAGLSGAVTEPSLNTLLMEPALNMYDDDAINFKDFAVWAIMWLDGPVWWP
ncbi:MAG: LamG domain-containing protein, partial [Sedimentisphaerales bacterium]|nr:LamG domain-containing protein [Sedimentisphaerales bacterium]